MTCFAARTLRVLIFALLILSSSAPGIAQTPTTVVWSADFETGNTSQWSAGQGGTQVNSGTSSAAASTDYARNGRWGLKMTTSAPPEGGSSLIRWLEPQTISDLNYAVSYYFPKKYTPTNYWNVLQWGSKDPSTGRVNPFFILNVGNRTDGSMYFYLYNWQTRQGYQQGIKNISVGQWLTVQARYVSAGDGTGHVTIWQDGTELFDLANVQTRYSGGDCQWSVNNLSDGIKPSPATFYIDDAVIGTTSSPVPPTPSPLTVTTNGLPNGTTGTAYSANLAASGGTSPYTWSLIGGSLPPGLALSSAGVISGTPSSAGVFSVTFQAKDSSQQTANSAKFNLTISSPPAGNVIWSADSETGDLSQWYYPSVRADGNEGGGLFNSGTANTVASQDQAHSGRWSMKMTIDTPPESGTRLFRWLEPHTHSNLTYSAWFYIPQRYAVTNYWNIFQWKSKVSSTGRVDPFFVLNVGNRSDGTMYLYLRNWQKGQSYIQTLKNVPVGQWFNVTANYVCAGDNTGRVTFWQDGTLLFDLQNVQTRYSNGDCQWSIDNYSDGLQPSHATIYTDDAQIVLK
jgi:hypothetical protein